MFAPIPHEYIRDKQKVLNVYFNLNEMDQFLLFCTRIKSSIDWNTNYTVYIKVRYHIDSYFMGGNPFGFIYDSENSLKDLYDAFRYKLEVYFKDYNLFPCGESIKGSLRGIPQGLDEDIVYVQITFRKYDIRILADFRKDIEWNKGDPVGDGGASIFRKSTNGFI